MPMKPAPLPPAFIESIVESIPPPLGNGRTNVAIAKRHLDARLRDYLSTIRLVPDERARNEFKQKVLQGYYESVVEPGTPVGIEAATSIAAPATQISLDTFHAAGSDSGRATGFLKIKSLLRGSKQRKELTMDIYFCDKTPAYPGDSLNTTLHAGTFESVMDKRPEYEQMMVSDLVLRDGATIEAEPGDDLKSLLDVFSHLYPERYYSVAERFPLTYVVRIELDTYRMYTHDITMAMIADAIQGPDNDTINVVWTPQSKGIAYVVVDETTDLEQDTMAHENALQVFLRNRVVLMLSSWQVSGIKGIRSIVPQRIDVVKGIQKTAPDPANPGRVLVQTNHHNTRWEGVSLADLHFLCGNAGLDPGEMDLDNLEFSIKYDGAQPLKTWLNQQDVDGKEFHIVRSFGANAAELAWKPGVDHFQTYSSQPHDVNESTGIDSAMVYLISVFRQTLKDFGYMINARHIGLIFALMCNLGLVNTMSYAGISRRRIGPLAAASTERSMQVFMNRSMFGAQEAITGVSEGIYVGQNFRNLGTGAVETEMVEPPVAKALPYTTENDLYRVLEDAERVEDYFNVQAPFATPAKEYASQPIDRERVREQTEILKQAPATPESLLPPSAKVVPQSTALRSALNKVTRGTNVQASRIHEQPHEDDAPSVIPMATESRRAKPYGSRNRRRAKPSTPAESAVPNAESPPSSPALSVDVEDLFEMAPEKK